MRDVYPRWLSDRNSEQLCSAWERVVEGDQSADFAETDFSDDDLEREDGFDSDDDDDNDLDSVAGFESVAGFDDVSLDDAVVPLVAGFSVVDVESDSVVPGVLFFA